MRIKRVHFVNISSIAETTLNFVKNFFPQKYRDRVNKYKSIFFRSVKNGKNEEDLNKHVFFQIVFNSSFEGLQDHYPVEMLPAEWGGKCGTMDELNSKCSSTAFLNYFKLLNVDVSYFSTLRVYDKLLFLVA